MAEAVAVAPPRAGLNVLQLALWGVRTAYFVSFAIPVFNPAINGTALYFYIWLPICDLQFLREIADWRVDRQRTMALGVGVLLFLLTLHSFEMSIRLALVAVQVLYLRFLLDHGLVRAISWVIVAHVLFAALQLAFFFTPGGVPPLLTPTGLSQAVWGAKYAPATFTNFGFESFLPRVSGLHRESGFFSAFVISVYLLVSETGYLARRRWLGLVLLVGLLASFSKITFAVILLFLLRRARRVIDRIPLWASVCAFVVVSVIAAGVIYGTLGQQALVLGEGTAVSFVHRFFGYYVLAGSSVFNALFGYGLPGSDLLTTDMRLYAQELFANIGGLRDYNLFPGLGGVLYRGGLLALAALVAVLTIARVRSTAALTLFIATFSVSLDTLQNFVVLVWFYVVLTTMDSVRALPKAPDPSATREVS